MSMHRECVKRVGALCKAECNKVTCICVITFIRTQTIIHILIYIVWEVVVFASVPVKGNSPLKYI